MTKSMTSAQIRIALTLMEENYSLAMGYKDYRLAQAYRDKVSWLQEELLSNAWPHAVRNTPKKQGIFTCE